MKKDMFVEVCCKESIKLFKSYYNQSLNIANDFFISKVPIGFQPIANEFKFPIFVEHRGL